MKHFFTLLFFVNVSIAVLGQTYLFEDFSSGMMPPAGWSIENVSNHWNVKPTNQAGGIAPEARFNYATFNGVTRLISPTINLTGLSTVTLMFKHKYSWYGNPAPSYGVATRSGSGVWTSVYEITPTGNVGPESVVVNISNSDVGQSDFQFCLFLNGNLDNVDFWYLDDIQLYSTPTLDAALISIQLPPIMAVGDSKYFSGIIENMGSTNISSFDIAYSIDGGTPFVYPISGLNLSQGETYQFTDSVPLTFTYPGSYHIVVNVQNVNDSVDNNTSNDTLDGYINVVSWIPLRKVFAEEGTGTWCGWCPRGTCYMDYMAATYPDTWIGASVHNYDPMTYEPWDSAYLSFFPTPSFPTGTIDRVGSSYLDPLDFETEYLKRIKDISPATVGIVNFSWDPETRIVSFDVESVFVMDYSHELRFAAVILEDSVHGTSSGYQQENEYAGGSHGQMCGFENLPNPVPASQMHYDYVGRVILDTPYGTEGSIPSPALSGQTYSHHYSYTIPSIWNYSNLRFVGLLMDHTTGTILNANDVVIYVGVRDQNHEIAMNVYPNPTPDITKIAFAINQPETISLSVCDIFGKQIYSEPRKNYAAGQNSINLNCSSFPNGFYLLKLMVGDKIYTQKIIVAK